MIHFFKKVLKVVLSLVVGVMIYLFIISQLNDTKYTSKKRGETVVEGTVTIVVDENEASFTQKMNKIMETENHPTGLRWHDINFVQDSHETHIRLVAGESSVTFDYPLGIQLLPTNGKLNDISLSLGFNDKPKMSHIEAKDHMYSILKKITDAGWKRYISASRVRLCGKEAYKAQIKTDVLMRPKLDENYYMNMEEWLSIGTHYWEFYYESEATMIVSLFREQDKHNPALASFFLSIDIETVESVWKRRYSNHSDWKAAARADIGRQKGQREKEEKEAIALGYHICTDYEDAPFTKGIFKGDDFVAKPTEDIIIRSGQLCPKEGQWQAFLPAGHPKEDIVKHSGMHTIWCAKNVRINTFGLSDGYENDIRWRWISDDNKTHNPNH